MDSSLVIGIISIIGAIHFSFAKNLIERIHDKNAEPEKKESNILKIYLFIPLSDGMVGYMFFAFWISILGTTLKQLKVDNNCVKWVCNGILFIIPIFFIFLWCWIWRDVNKVDSYCKKKFKIKSKEKWIVRVMMVLFFILVSGSSIYLYCSKDCTEPEQLLEYLQNVAVILSLASFSGWLICITALRPLLNLDRYLRKI